MWHWLRKFEAIWASWISPIGSLTRIVDSLPESRFKEFLRSRYRRYYARYHNPLPALNKIVSKVESLQDGSLFVELNNGTKFYGLPDKTESRLITMGDPQKLGKLKDYKYFGSFLGTLHEQYVEGVYEKYYELKKGDIVVDMGAYIGAFALKAARAIGDRGTVIAIEPDKDSLRFLERNISINRVKNVTIVEKGIWSKAGKLKLYLSGGAGHSFSQQWTGSNEFIEVEVDTLDNILRQLGVRRVDFIKMDIEGAEIEALRGMEQTLGKSDVRLAIAAYHILNGKVTAKIIAPQLSEKGFEVRIKEGIVYGEKKDKLVLAGVSSCYA